MKEQSLYDKLLEYGESDYVPFHMPGHKRQQKEYMSDFPWNMDITEIDGFDNLHHAQGILKESMDLAASFYHTEKTLYSINGSTAGILSAIFAVTKPGDKILVARNSHKSVYHGIFLRNLIPIYVYPQMDEECGIACGYSSKKIEEVLISNPDSKAVVITSPTYEGMVSDIQSIAAIVHKKGIPLIVDEAHGAHLSTKVYMNGSMSGPEGRLSKGSEDKLADGYADEFTNGFENVGIQTADSQMFPISATCLGADLVIQSLHKTLPALTQTAVLHVCRTELQQHVSLAKEAARYMSIFQTSSPSYILMASIDSCIRYQMSKKGQDDQRKYYDSLQQLRQQLRQYRHIHLLEPKMKEQKLDPSKLILAADGMTGKQLYDRLRKEYHLQPEMCTGHYVLLMTSVFDTQDMYQRLLFACKALDGYLEEKFTDKKEIKEDIRKDTRADTRTDVKIDTRTGARVDKKTDKFFAVEFYGNNDRSECAGNLQSLVLSGDTMAVEDKPSRIYTPSQADMLETEEILLCDSVGRVSAEYAYQYPPGIPLLVPGEKIEKTILNRLMGEAEAGIEIQGLHSLDSSMIRVIKDDMCLKKL